MSENRKSPSTTRHLRCCGTTWKRAAIYFVCPTAASSHQHTHTNTLALASDLFSSFSPSIFIQRMKKTETSHKLKRIRPPPPHAAPPTTTTKFNAAPTGSHHLPTEHAGRKTKTFKEPRCTETVVPRVCDLTRERGGGPPCGVA